MTKISGRSFLAMLLILLVSAPQLSRADQQLLINGGFENGLQGWQVWNLPGSDPSGGFFLGNNLIDPNLTPNSPASPVSELATVGAKSGNYYAISDSLGPGTHALLQPFTLPTYATSLNVGFDLFVNDWFGAGALNQFGPLNHNQLDANGQIIPTQFARVDLLKAGADAFSTDPGDIVANFYLGVDPLTPANPYSYYSYHIEGLTGGSFYEFRVAEADNQFTLNAGIDDVSITTVAPEGDSLLLLAGGGLAFLATPLLRHRTRLHCRRTT